MFTKSKFIFAGVALLLSGVAFAAELVVTQGETQSKSGQVAVTLDLASAGDVSGFQFILRSSEQMKLGSVDVSKCLSDLPKGFSGQCRQNEDGIYFSALASGKSVLPAGVVSLGSLSLPAGAAKAQFTVDQLEMINADAEIISSQDQVVR
ncbi:hypothetical protein [uncultured Aquimonas sp.]|uniref:hypothetical protein n=1 Tax=uncultured Aquimonas sp. TaxID=385483 RepID=UPI00086F35B3|nr:hypothetical protein [uncultured Aquimonas sp.]ODU47887.1 MAG: hypothetical protein ABS96_02985 [Xanthomonadaceae bacterium SCN 69-123]